MFLANQSPIVFHSTMTDVTSHNLTVEEIPVPFSLFLFRHYLNNLMREPSTIAPSPEPIVADNNNNPAATVPATYYISTDPNDDPVRAASKSKSSTVVPSVTSKNVTGKGYRNTQRKEEEDAVGDTSWMTMEMPTSQKPKPKKKSKNKGTLKTEKKKEKEDNRNRMNHDHSTTTPKPSDSLEDQISPFLVADLDNALNDIADEESWTTVEKHRR